MNIEKFDESSQKLFLNALVRIFHAALASGDVLKLDSITHGRFNLAHLLSGGLPEQVDGDEDGPLIRITAKGIDHMRKDRGIVPLRNGRGFKKWDFV